MRKFPDGAVSRELMGLLGLRAPKLRQRPHDSFMAVTGFLLVFPQNVGSPHEKVRSLVSDYLFILVAQY